MSELTQVLDTLISCGESLIRAANALKEMERQAAAVGTPAATTYTYVDVRKACSAKSYAGFTDQVKALICKYGDGKLSSVQECDYDALMAELEAIQ